LCGKGSSGGYGGLAPIQQSTTQASPQAINAYTKALGLADVAAAQPFQQYSTDPNAFVAPLTGTQQQAIGGLYGAQGAYQPYYQGAGQLTASAGTTAAPQLAGQYMNPFMQQVINPVLQQQGQQLAQQQAEAIRGGAFGGERAGLQRQALRGQQELALGQLYAGGYGQALGAAQSDLARQLQAGQALGALGTGAQTAALQAPQALLGAGTLEQQTQQAGLTALYNQFLQGRAYPYQQAQFYSNIAGGLGPLLGQTTYQSQAQNPFGMFLSEPGAKMGVDGYADGGVPQDRSQPDVVGRTFDDQNIYAYRYKDGSPAQLGLMADEVQRAHPEAVGYAPTGDRMVDYAAATDAAARMGGAVKETGDYARGGYAIGGHLSYVDPSDPGASDRRRMEALIASHKGGLSGAASEYGPSGESYVTQKTYVPAGTVRAGRQLEHARFSAPQQQQGGLGSALATGEKLGGLLSKGYEAYNKYKDYKTLKLAPQEMAQSYELNYDRGGIVPTSYLPEEITGEVRASEGLRPAEISGGGQEKESGINKLMGVGEKALDIGMKYGPALSTLASKALPFLASFSEPNMKTGVRPAARDGMGIRPANEDDIFERGIIGAESRGRQFDREGRPLTSPAGAIGIAQVMPGTAPEAAKLAGLDFDPVRYRNDPEYNKALGKAYFNKQLETFGSEDKAAAAYNAGPGALQKALARAEREGGDYLSYLPAETRAYVPKVMGLAGARGEDEGITRVTPEAVSRARSGLGLDRMAGSFTPEQRRMMALDESSKSGVGAAKEEGGLGDYLTSEEFLIPALTGLGTAATTMLGAPTTSLGSAIGMGLGAGTVAGAQQVLPTKAKQAEIERAKQEAGRIGVESQKIAGVDTQKQQAEIDAIRAGLYQTVVVPGEGVLLFDKNNPYAGYTKIMEADGTPVSGKERIVEEVKRSGSPTSTTPQQPHAWEVPTATDVPANYKPSGQAPLALDPTAAQEAKTRGYAEAEKARSIGADASRQMMRIAEMEEAVKSLETPKGGWLTKQGPWADQRLNLAKGINFLTSSITGKEALPADEIASMEVLNKDAFRLGSSAISALSGHPAASIVEQSVVATPSLANTKMGYQRLLAGLKLAAQYEQDRGKFFSNYYNKFHNTQQAQELFDQLNPPQKYAQKAIASVILPAHLDALRKYGPNIKDRIDKIYGAGTTDTLLMGQ
jgi:hypothetical protein